MRAEGGSHAAAGAQNVAPGIVCVGYRCRAAGVQDRRYVALQIGGIVVIRTVVGNGHGGAGRIIGKVQGVAAHGLKFQDSNNAMD